MSLRTLLSTILLLAAVTAAAQGASDDPPEWRDRRPRMPRERWIAMEGKPAPALEGLSHWLNTDPLGWDDLEGNVVLLQMWGSWRPSCVRAIPHLIELAERHADQGLVILGVHSKQGIEEFTSFVEEMAVPYVVAADGTGAFQETVAAATWPTYHIVGRDGKVRIAGVSKREDAEGEAFLDQALAAILDEPWEGERRVVEIRRRVERNRTDHKGKRWRKKHIKPSPPLILGPDGWPAPIEKELYAKRDLRGKQAPQLQVQHWLTPKIDTKDRPVLIYFWVTWMEPCVETLPLIQKLHSIFGEELVVIAISDQAPDLQGLHPGKPWGPIVARFLELHPQYTFPQAIDGKARTRKALGVQAQPYVLIHGGDGVVRWQGRPNDESDPLTEKLVAKIVEKDAQRRAEEAARVRQEQAREKKEGQGDGGEGGDGGDDPPP